MLKFKPEDWKELKEYLLQWDQWRRKEMGDRPDHTSDAIFLGHLQLHY